MKVLLIGFDGLNSPTKMVINELKINSNIDVVLLKNNFHIIGQQLREVIDGKNKYNYILIIGQKKGSKGITLERVALNIGSKNTLLIENGDVAYFNTLPLEKIYKKFKNNNLSIRYSNNAGAKYCNCAFYNTMHLLKEKNLDTLAGLIHIPNKSKTNTIDDLKNKVRLIIDELTLTCH